MRKRNKGSATIEITLLMPIFLGCIYFYIMLFLFLIESGKDMQILAEYLYLEEGNQVTFEQTEKKTFVKQNDGKIVITSIKEEFSIFEINIELSKDSNNAIENIRRWQLAAELL